MSQHSETSEDYNDPAFLESKLKRITYIERTLDHLVTTHKGGQQESRMQLCELYSGVFLGNPSFALRQNLLERLWRNCFYDSIGEQRRDISKRKKKNQPIDKARKAFHGFLQEAIELYSYMVNFYSVTLAPELSSSQSEIAETTLDLDGEGEKAVVMILHKFMIYLGDLFRYKDQYNDAAARYQCAALLAPGQGNPYNQMAVLEQLKESSCNALYWYARSIKASSKSFETSISNVDRLFDSNCRWLKENPTDGIPTKAADKAKKVAASKRFNACFVDLQRQLRARGKSMEEGVKQSTDSFIRSLEILMSSQSLSDTLLCRMVVVSAWTAEECRDSRFSQILILRFGAALADVVAENVAKIPSSPTSVPAIRALSPFLIICDYAANLTCRDCEDYNSAQKLFWSKATEIANQVGRHRTIFELEKYGDMLPKDYKELKGFSPFEAFIERPPDILSFEDARGVVPMMGEMSAASKKSESPSAETCMKLARLLASMERSDKVVKDKNGRYRLAAQPETIELDSDDDNAPHAFDDEPEADVLMYKPPEHGSGPALLVPGALLQNKAVKVDITVPERPSTSVQVAFNPPPFPFPTPMASPLAKNDAPVRANTSPPFLQSPPGLRPPPGFAVPTEPQNGFIAPSQNHLDFLSQIPTANPFHMPPPQQQIQYQSTYPPFTTPADPNNFLDQDEPVGLLDSSLLQSLWGEEKPVSSNPFLTQQKW